MTGWINELSAGPGKQRLHAPVLSDNGQPITGEVRYEVVVNAPAITVNLGGSGHLGYPATDNGLRTARLSKRQYQDDVREALPRSAFEITVTPLPDATQPLVELSLENGFEPGMIYELIYEAQDPVLAGAGMAAIRDLVSLLRYADRGDAEFAELYADLNVPAIEHSAAWGISQSGRLLRQFVYDGFNAD